MKKFWSLLLAISLFGAVNITPVFATDSDNEIMPINDETFIEEFAPSAEAWQFGNNVLAAGNALDDSSTVDGLFFAFGNQLNIRSASEYNFIAGNVINYNAATLKDAFIAGNLIRITSQSQIGRDLYIAGNQVTIEHDLPGDLSIAAASITFADITIDGDVNLTADTINFSENTKISGTLTYNDNASLSGFNVDNYAIINTYTPDTDEPTASEIWLNQFMKMVSFFILIAAIFWLLPNAKQKLFNGTMVENLPKLFAIGVGFLILAPLVCLILLITVFAAPAAFVILAVYILMLFLAQVFAGAFLGYLIVECLMHNKLPALFEALIGIVLYGCMCLIPGVSSLITIIGTILGLGLIISCLRGTKNEASEHNQQGSKSPENPFRSQKQSSAKSATKSSASSPASAVSSKSSAKSTDPSRSISTKVAKSSKSSKSSGASRPAKTFVSPDSSRSTRSSGDSSSSRTVSSPYPSRRSASSQTSKNSPKKNNSNR